MKRKSTALIIDDEPDIRELLEITLNRMQVDSIAAATLDEAHRRLQTETFDICLTDMRLPDGDGVDFVRFTQANYPAMPIAVITAHGSMDTAITALKYGAFDFLTKPVDLTLLRNIVRGALKLAQRPADGAVDGNGADQLIGQSPAIVHVKNMIAKLARSQAPIYISGESGTGKELAARLIHGQGARRGKPFIPVNCGAIPHDLMESEFFGYVKGSFTGAHADKAGLFSAAEGGTLFLDEVADLPPHIQVKLLRAIQENAVRPIGATAEQPVDVRILCATHKDLRALAQAGEFRQDLYYRINVIELNIPPLRRRAEDIPALARHFLNVHGGDDAVVIDPQALAALRAYAFPGNIRELENILQRAATLCEGKVIRAHDLHLPQDDNKNDDQNNTAPVASASPLPAGATAAAAPLDSYLVDVERNIITQALERHKWNKTAAAKHLGITLRALRYRLEKLGLDE